MRNQSPEVDAYIADAADFARPILEKVRALFHKACPDIEETIKWGFPHFEYRGMVGSMAAFKQHAAFGFWKGTLLSDPHGLFKGVGKTTMGALKVCTLADMPADRIVIDYIREAVKLNEDGVKAPAPTKTAKKDVDVPEFFVAALKKNKKALATFEGFSPSNKREYIDWLNDAKQETTRLKRLETALEWLAEGKTKNWKYER